jgi:hypothetical protein
VRKIMKKSILIVAVILLILATYCLGYYKGINDATFLLSTTKAAIQMGTITYINEGKYEKAKGLNFTDLQSSMAAVEDINGLNGRLTKIPGRALLYFRNFPAAQDFMTEQVHTLKPRYEKLMTEAKSGSGTGY